MLNLLILLAVAFPFFVITIWALIDIILKDFKSTIEKGIWFAIASIPFIGALIYFLIGRKRGKKE